MKTIINKYGLRLVKESSKSYDLIKHITRPIEAVYVLNDVAELNRRTEEVFVIITLDNTNKLTGLFEVSVGSLTASIVTPREVFKRAILQNAQSIVMAHNHPSGEIEPSREDIDISKRMVKIGEMLGIEVFDHIIIGESDNYLSLRKEGII